MALDGPATPATEVLTNLFLGAELLTMLDSEYSAQQVVFRCDTLAVTLPPGVVHVGRGADCFICLEDPGVSRLHFRVVVGRTVMIEDLGSKNGTLVNGEHVRGSRPLNDGDEIRVGERVFVVSLGAPGAPEEEVTPPWSVPRATLQGIGEAPQVGLGERCPRCGDAVSFGATTCASCGFEWPRGSRRAPTRQANGACRRRNQRFPVQIPARFASPRWEGQGQILNLSMNGAFLSAPRTEQVGTRCTIEVRSEQLQIVALNGFVRHAIHRGDRGMGIEFEGLDRRAEQWLCERLQVTPR